MTVTGFYSVVTDTQRKGRMLIRARTKSDINNLFERHKTDCPTMEPPTSDDARDYRYRLSISQKDWMKLAAKLAGEVTYPNFKMAVHERADQADKKAAYAEIWWTMRRVQEHDGKDNVPQRPANRKVRKQ